MTNDIKDDVFTEEQKDFIFNYLNKNRPPYSQLVNPDKISDDMKQYMQNNLSRYGQQPITDSDDWLQKLCKLNPSLTSISMFSHSKVPSVEKYAKSNYSEMSEIEKVTFIKNSLSVYKSNTALSIALSSPDVMNATNVSALEKALNTVLNDKNLPNNSLLSGPQFSSAGTRVASPSEHIMRAKAIVGTEMDVAKVFKNYPATPEPEPVVEKPKGFSTTSKDHKVRIEQWMEHLGMKDDAQALIDKYGLPVAYEVVQTAMQGPADMTKATDGKFRNSKDSIKYFLDNDVSAEKLATLPDLDAETVKASLESVKKPEPIVRPEPLPTISIDLPGATVSKPTLSEADMKKVHYAALVRDTLKLDGIDEAEIKAAVDVALESALKHKDDAIESWSGGFKYNLSQALGLDKITDDPKTYKDWALALNDCSNKAIENSSGEPAAELAEQVAIYTGIANRQLLKSDLAGMSATETLNPETYFKDRQVQKQLLARAEKKAEREERKEERKANRQENVDTMKDWFKKAKSLVD